MAQNDACFIQYASGAEFEYNDFGFTQVVFGASPSGPGNVSVDPLFVNAGADDFQLQSSSPVRGAGTFVYLNANVDLLNNTRVNLNSPDMGAYQYMN